MDALCSHCRDLRVAQLVAATDVLTDPATTVEDRRTAAEVGIVALEKLTLPTEAEAVQS